MAFFRVNCRALTPLRLPRTRYYSSEQGISKEFPSQKDGLIEESKIPMVPKRKDSQAVLKALASTVEPLSREVFHGIGAADPMYPQSKFIKMDYIKHNEAGRTAARYIMHRWPDLFKLKELDTKPAVEKMKPLEKYIAKKRLLKAMWMYNKMKENGEEISLDTRNNLLELVAYYGLGNPWVDVSCASTFLASYQDLSCWPADQVKMGKESDVAVSEENLPDSVVLSKTRIEDGFKVWRLDNDAEKLFSEMEDKNGETYEALIQGLVKFKNIRRAFDIFDEMQSRGFQAHTETYNLLLSALLDNMALETWTKAKHLLKCMSSKPIAHPNTRTFNMLLEVAASEESSASLSSKIVREMFHVGVVPTLTTFYHLLKTNSSRGEALVVKSIVSYLEKNPQVVRFQDEHCHRFLNAALDACRALGDKSLTIRLKRISEKCGNRGLIDNYIIFASRYLVSLCGGDSAALDTLIIEYRKMVPLELIPFEWVYGSMFKACAEAGQIDVVMELWSDVLKHNVKIEKSSTVNHLCGVFKDVKCSIEESEKYISMIENAVRLLYKNNGEPSAHTITILIKLACNSRDLEKAWSFYDWYDRIQAPPMFTALYALLKAHYKSPEKDSIIWIMKKMIEQGMSLPEKDVLRICEGSDIDPTISAELAKKMRRDTNNIYSH